MNVKLIFSFIIVALMLSNCGQKAASTKEVTSSEVSSNIKKESIIAKQSITKEVNDQTVMLTLPEAQKSDKYLVRMVAAINTNDWDDIESLRTYVKPEHIATLSALWSKDLADHQRNSFVTLLMDQKLTKDNKALMIDGLESNSDDVRSNAICILLGENCKEYNFYSKSGWVQPKKVDAAIKAYKQRIK